MAQFLLVVEMLIYVILVLYCIVFYVTYIRQYDMIHGNRKSLTPIHAKEISLLNGY